MLQEFNPANADLQSLLNNGEFKLLPVDRADELAGPIFSPRVAPRGLLRAQDELAPEVTEKDLQTVATTTFLAAKNDAADRLVKSTLETLYANSDLVQQFDLFPLKASHELDVSGNLSAPHPMLNLYDIQGRLVLTTKLDNTVLQNRIDVSTINSGVYVVTIQSNEQERTKKVIID